MRVEEFDGDEGTAVFFADVVDGANVWMIERRGGLGFAAGTFERLAMVGEVVGKKADPSFD